MNPAGTVRPDKWNGVMTADKPRRIWPWIVAVLVGVPVLYVFSLPVAWWVVVDLLNRADDLLIGADQEGNWIEPLCAFYVYPVRIVVRRFPGAIDWLNWYVTLFHPHPLIPPPR